MKEKISKRDNASFSQPSSKANSREDSPLLQRFQYTDTKIENKINKNLLPGKIYTLTELRNHINL